MFDEATLWKLLDRELPPTEAERIEAAAAKDPVLAERIARLRAVKDGVLDGAPVPSPDFAARVEARAREGTPFQVLAEPPRRSQTWLKVAAVLLIGLGIANLWAELRTPLLAGKPEVDSGRSVEQRVDDYAKALEKTPLSALQRRQLHDILVLHDRENKQIRQLTPEQLGRILALEERSRGKVQTILSDEQQAELARVREQAQDKVKTRK